MFLSPYMGIKELVMWHAEYIHLMVIRSVAQVLVEGEQATLKRLRKKGASIALEPANRNYETKIYGSDQVAVQGKLVGLMRRYH